MSLDAEGSDSGDLAEEKTQNIPEVKFAQDPSSLILLQSRFFFPLEAHVSEKGRIIYWGCSLLNSSYFSVMRWGVVSQCFDLNSPTCASE